MLKNFPKKNKKINMTSAADTYIANQYLLANPLTGQVVASLGQIPIGTAICPSEFGWSPAKPLFINSYLNLYPNNAIEAWTGSTTPATTSFIADGLAVNTNFGTVQRFLPKGDYLLTLSGYTNTNLGILTVTVGHDATITQQNLDMYSASAANVVQLTVPFSTTYPQLVTVNLEVLSKNASSSAYGVAIANPITISSVNTTVS
jgi:hypothetical protein